MVQFDPNIFLKGAEQRRQSNQNLLSVFQTIAGQYNQAQQRKAVQMDKLRARAEKQAQDPMYIATLLQQGKEVTPEQRAILEASINMKQQYAFDPQERKYLTRPTVDEMFPQKGVFDTIQPQPVASKPVQDTVQQHTVVAEQKAEIPVPLGDKDVIRPKGVSRQMWESPKTQSEIAKKSIEHQFKSLSDMKKAEFEKKKSRPKVDMAFKSLSGDVSNIIGVIDKVIDNIDYTTSGFGGAFLSYIPGTDAHDLEKNLETIQADAAFGRLQEMRDSSPTGGALGQVSERELALLQSAKVALEQSQSPEQLEENLRRYKQIRENAFKNVAEAYKQDYGEYPKGYNIKELTDDNVLTTEQRKRLEELRAKRGIK